MDWKIVGKLWFGTILIFTLGTMLFGCSNNQRWSPTDPLADEFPDTSNITIEATWELDIDATVTP